MWSINILGQSIDNNFVFNTSLKINNYMLLVNNSQHISLFFKELFLCCSKFKHKSLHFHSDRKRYLYIWCFLTRLPRYILTLCSRQPLYRDWTAQWVVLRAEGREYIWVHLLLCKLQMGQGRLKFSEKLVFSYKETSCYLIFPRSITRLQ